jgi:hypothetical protein
MSDTPRTDAALRKARPSLHRERDAMYCLACQLERELNEAHEDLAKAIKQVLSKE